MTEPVTPIQAIADEDPKSSSDSASPQRSFTRRLEWRGAAALGRAPKPKEKQESTQAYRIRPGDVIFILEGYARVISKQAVAGTRLVAFEYEICARPLEGDAAHQRLIVFRIHAQAYLNHVLWYREEPTLFSAPPLLHLVGCARTKRAEPAPAKDLYVSPLFSGIRRYVESEPWAILSARHGLIWPDQVIEPYDETLAHFTTQQRREWSRRVLGALPPALRYVMWAGARYTKHLAPILSAELPLQGLGIGQQLSFLNKLSRGPATPSR